MSYMLNFKYVKYVKYVKYITYNIEIIAFKWKIFKFMCVWQKNHSFWDQTDNNIPSVITISTFFI
jgi:hypothetical protein